MILSKDEMQEIEKFNFRMNKLHLDMNNMSEYGFNKKEKTNWLLDMAKIAIEQNEFLNKCLHK